jgi:hypothetical protein
VSKICRICGRDVLGAEGGVENPSRKLISLKQKRIIRSALVRVSYYLNKSHGCL